MMWSMSVVSSTHQRSARSATGATGRRPARQVLAGIPSTIDHLWRWTGDTGAGIQKPRNPTQSIEIGKVLFRRAIG